MPSSTSVRVGGFQVSVGTREGFGYTFVDNEAVSIAEDLSSATLAPTTVLIEDTDTFGGMVVDQVTVTLSFAGTGELTRFYGGFKLVNDRKLIALSKDLQLQGVATLTLDGQAYRTEGVLTIS